MTAKAIGTALPEIAGTNEGPMKGPHVVLPPRMGPHRAEEDIAPDDAEAGSWIDAAAQMSGKLDAFADLIGVDLSYLLKMRKGIKPLNGAHLVRMKGHVEIVLAFVAPLLESIKYVARPVNGITAAQVGIIAARLLGETRPSREMLERECQRIHGATAAEVALALQGKGGDE